MGLGGEDLLVGGGDLRLPPRHADQAENPVMIFAGLGRRRRPSCYSHANAGGLGGPGMGTSSPLVFDVGRCALAVIAATTAHNG